MNRARHLHPDHGNDALRETSAASGGPPPSIWQDRLFDPVGGNIPADMPLMVLRADDPLAASLVLAWASRQTEENAELAIRAEEVARAMQRWAERHAHFTEGRSEVHG